MQATIFKSIIKVEAPIIEEETVFVPSIGPNVTAYIKSISIFGDMIIEFNASMFTTFDYALLNSSLVDMYIIPNDPQDGFNVSWINFTWTLTNFTEYKNHMHIKLNFTNTTAISINLEQDVLCFHIKNESDIFYSTEVGKMLHNSSWTMESKVRKQLEETYLNVKAMEASATSSEVMQFTLIGVFLFCQMVSGDGFRYFNWYLRSL